MTVYNKIFTKILDSSIWLEPTTTRLVWLTFIAAMDEDGFVQFASVANLAHRARVPIDEAQLAVGCLEGADANSSDPENEGRRIEKVPGGWMILNSAKYREMVTRIVTKQQTRERVAKFRQSKKEACNGDVTGSNGDVTPSDTTTHSESASEPASIPQPPPKARKRAVSVRLDCAAFREFWTAYPRKEAIANAESAWVKNECAPLLPQILVSIRARKICPEWLKDGGRFIPHPATWLNRRGWEDEVASPHTKRGIAEDFSHLLPKE